MTPELDEQRPLAAVPPAPLPPPVQPGPQLPPEQLRGLLRHYRRHSVSFDIAWELALRSVRWPPSRRDAAEWRTAVEDTREGWRASFERWPQESREAAVSELARTLSEDPAVAHRGSDWR